MVYIYMYRIYNRPRKNAAGQAGKQEGYTQEGGYPGGGYPCLLLTSSGTDAGGVQPTQGSESGQLSSRGFEPKQTPTAGITGLRPNHYPKPKQDGPEVKREGGRLPHPVCVQPTPLITQSQTTGGE